MRPFHCKRLAHLCIALVLAATAAVAIRPAQGQIAPAGKPQRQGPAHVMSPPPTADAIDAILGRPTDRSIALSVISRDRARRAVIAVGPEENAAANAPASSPLKARQAVTALALNQPATLSIEGLKPDTAYRWELRDADGGEVWLRGRFHTQRAAGRTFTFTVTADSHLDQHTDPSLYQATLAQAAAAAPDFHVDLGDTFMTDKHASFPMAAVQYQAQRHYLAQLGREVPLFLVLGNHDGEDARLRRGGSGSIAVQANALRKALFPNPVPDGFFSGNTEPDPDAGTLQDYYAFHWGDALFIALNPYWNAAAGRSNDGWGLSLGRSQYDWLARTLAQSRARHKFVFIHQLVGGLGKAGRGGAEAAGFGEWGGLNQDGGEGFSTHRAGWPEPIHAVLKRHGVTTVFHGHDHLFARQSRDGIVYQLVPQPGSAPGNPAKALEQAKEYGYRDGEIHGQSGHLRVQVSADAVRTEFVPTPSAAPMPARKPGAAGAAGTAAGVELPTADHRNTAGGTSGPAKSEKQPQSQPEAQPDAQPEDQPKTQPKDQPEKRGQRAQRRNPPMPQAVAEQAQLSVILGRPTATGIAANVLTGSARVVYIEHGPQPGRYTHRTPEIPLQAQVPHEIELAGLPANAPRYYRLRWRAGNSGAASPAHAFLALPEQRFHTQRAPGSTFTFELQGDSHPERAHQFDAELYARTLTAAAQQRPDFYFTLGDDFSVDTLPEWSRTSVTERYLLQRPYLALIGQTAPLFLVNGNHEQAAAANLNGTADNVAVWAQNARNSLFPQPAPDGFYSGNAKPVEHIGLLRNYFAWHWGDALFVVIDPYWHTEGVVDNPLGSRDKGGNSGPSPEAADRSGQADTPMGRQAGIQAGMNGQGAQAGQGRISGAPSGAQGLQGGTRGGRGGVDGKGGRDLWRITLGQAQYDWLAQTLQASPAKFKFVFAHHVLGTGRGGVGMARLYEWGGRGRNGADEFAARRPGWAMPIHNLFVKHGVTAFFQGHDHVFAREQLDGVTYQTAPEPADASGTLYFQDAYHAAQVFGNSGRIRVTVSPNTARVSYVRPTDAGAESVVFSYELAPRSSAASN